MRGREAEIESLHGLPVGFMRREVALFVLINVGVHLLCHFDELEEQPGVLPDLLVREGLAVEEDVQVATRVDPAHSVQSEQLERRLGLAKLFLVLGKLRI